MRRRDVPEFGPIRRISGRASACTGVGLYVKAAAIAPAAFHSLAVSGASVVAAVAKHMDGAGTAVPG